MIIKKHSEIEFVKGFNRTCVYDIARRDYDFIPNEIADFFRDPIEEHSIANVDSEIKKWFDFLIEKEYLFKIPTKLKDNFVDIKRTFEKPNHLEFAILELNNDNVDHTILNKLQNLFCRNICLIVDDFKNLKCLLEEIQSKFFFETINILLINDIPETEKELLLGEYFNLNNIKKIEKTQEDNSSFFTPHFRILIDFFNEAQSKNVFYNKRIYINKEGYYSSNINNTDFSAKLFIDTNNIEFEIWNISKDKCFVCKDCEFRYMCVDNRNIDKLNENQYYYTSECSYNPYISKWSHEEDFCSVRELDIKFPDFIINKELVEKKVLEIW